MPISSLLLVLVAAFIHAGWNLLAKKASGGAPFVWLYGLVACVVYQPVAVVFWMRDDGVPHGWTWLFVVGTAVLHLGYALSLQRGYRLPPTSRSCTPSPGGRVRCCQRSVP